MAKISSKDGSKVMTVIASPGQGPDRSTEVSYTDTKVSFHLLTVSLTSAKVSIFTNFIGGNLTFKLRKLKVNFELQNYTFW